MTDLLNIHEGEELTISTGILNVLMKNTEENIFAAEATRNGQQYGASMVVFSPVWDAVRRTGNYTLGIWTDSVFLPENMDAYMPRIGETDFEAIVNGNFHAGSRLSMLGWSDFAVVSRPDPKKPDDIFVTFLYQAEDGSYRTRRWTNGWASPLRRQKVIRADDLTDDEIDMLGFDPMEIPTDEGWLNRLETAGKKPNRVPMTCFVLCGRGDHRDTYQGQTGTGRPLTRSVINDRFWKPTIDVWAWEVQNPDQRDQWLTVPPDGKKGGVPWKVDSSHQWRQQHGLSRVAEGGRRELPEYDKSVLLDDGTIIEIRVFPETAKGKSPLDNAAYAVVRNGGYVVDFQGENYHTDRGVDAVGGWGIFNGKMAPRTLIRAIPPVWSAADPDAGGMVTDIARSKLSWQEGPSTKSIERKLSDWRKQIRLMMASEDAELGDLLRLMSGGSRDESIDSFDITRDLSDLATEMGPLYTRKVIVTIEVPDPDATKPGPGRARRKRETTTCPECYHKLPFPGHADDCSLKPAPPEPKEVLPGRLDWDGDPDPNSGIDGRPVPDPDATKEEDHEIEIPNVTFCHVEPVDWGDLRHGRSWYIASWSPEQIGPQGQQGVLRIGYGKDALSTDRHPYMIQARERIAESYGIALTNQDGMHKIDAALWTTIYRLLAGKFGHVLGQWDAGTFPADSPISDLRDREDHPAILYGVTWTLSGIQDLERFVRPILSQTLGPVLAKS